MNRGSLQKSIKIKQECFIPFMPTVFLFQLSVERQRKPPNADKMESWGTAIRNNATQWIKQR